MVDTRGSNTWPGCGIPHSSLVRGVFMPSSDCPGVRTDVVDNLILWRRCWNGWVCYFHGCLATVYIIGEVFDVFFSLHCSLWSHFFKVDSCALFRDPCLVCKLSYSSKVFLLGLKVKYTFGFWNHLSVLILYKFMHWN